MVYMRSSVFWGVTQRTLVVVDVLQQPVGPIIEGQTVLTLEDGTDRSS